MWQRAPLLLAVVVLGGLAAAGCAGQSGSASSLQSNSTQPGSTQPALTPEEARRAILTLIRSRPGTFTGSPDADRLANLPLVDKGDGVFRFGAFYVRPTEGWYSATIGWGAPHAIEYHGRISRIGGKWVASEPEVRHMYRTGK